MAPKSLRLRKFHFSRFAFLRISKITHTQRDQMSGHKVAQIFPKVAKNGFYWVHRCSWYLAPVNRMGLLQEVTRPKARFKPTLPDKSGVDGGVISCLTIARLLFALFDLSNYFGMPFAWVGSSLLRFGS